jgi:SMC interacting uncharacterized protein involved in chromosome segregation
MANNKLFDALTQGRTKKRELEEQRREFEAKQKAVSDDVDVIFGGIQLSQVDEDIRARNLELQTIRSERDSLIAVARAGDAGAQQRLDELANREVRIGIQQRDLEVLRIEVERRESARRTAEEKRAAAQKRSEALKVLREFWKLTEFGDTKYLELAAALEQVRAFATRPELAAAIATLGISGGRLYEYGAAKSGGLGRPTKRYTRAARHHGLGEFIEMPFEAPGSSGPLKFDVPEDAGAE